MRTFTRVALLALLTLPLYCPAPARADTMVRQELALPKPAPETGNPLVARLEQRFGPSPGGYVIIVHVPAQRLDLYRHGARIASWPVSTSRYGVGNRENSEKTPLGVHRIAKKIGAGAPLGTLFRARRDTGRTVPIHTDDTPADGDYVTTRILWLKGIEPGVNEGKGVDSYHRFIYIHGTPEEGRIGRPFSHGCIRMRNRSVVELFRRVKIGTLVDIVDK
jgi:hypothetical protein